jgi:adenosylhomocysteine nucleosidase
MSADIAITDPCVVFALRRESMYFRRAHPYQQRFPGAPCRAQFRGSSSQTVLMLETGLGAAAMETALRWSLNAPRFGEVPYRPRFVLSAGFSGALQAEQHVGDVILATEIIDESANCWPVTWPGDIPDGEMPSRGRLLTVSQLVGDPQDKQRLGQQYQALAVDMETAIVARMCLEYGVPFACVRVISDELNTPLSPHLIHLLRDGRVSLLRLTWSLVRHPMLCRELWRLAGQTRFAARRLASVCQRIGRG